MVESLTDFTWSGFVHGFVSSLTVIVVSEIGDKTFFIAAIMAMRHPRLTVFISAVSALVLMTVISVVFGWLASAIPHSIIYYTSTALFALFGLKMLWDGWRMPSTAAKQEMDRVQADLCARDNEGVDYSVRVASISEDIQATTSEVVCEDPVPAPTTIVTSDNASKVTPEAQPTSCDQDTGLGKRHKIKEWSRVFLQCFTMIFLSEWGDRSQITTIALAAKEDIYGVMVGGSLGHTLCTGLAVLGGRLLAHRISVRTVTFIGGVIFLLFAVYDIIFRSDA